MRHIFLSLSVLIFLGITTFSAEFQADQNTMALYHFNEGSGSILTDASGKNNNGSISGGTWVDGILGKALGFNGINSGVVIPYNSKLDLDSNYTVECWVKPKSNSNSKIYNTSGITVRDMDINIFSNDSIGMFTPKENSADGAIAWSPCPFGKIDSLKWHYIAAVVKNSNISQLYVDGILVSEVIKPIISVSLSGAIYIGRASFSGYLYNGSIDEFRISNSARTASEIKAHWDENKVSPNNAPGFISTPDTLATEDMPWSYSVLAIDVDAGDVVTYSLRNPITDMQLSTNTLKWTPTNANVGSNIVTIRATDSHGAFSEQTFRIRVTNVNDTPTITSLAPTAAVQSQLFQYQAQASDPDFGDVLTWQLTTAPLGMSISSSGLISWTPTQAQIGSQNVVVQVHDFAGLSAQQTFAISVTNVNDAPIIVDPTAQNATEDLPFSLKLNATDPDGNQTFWFVVQGPESLNVDMNTGLLSWTPKQKVAGTSVQVKIRATDAVLSDTTTFSIAVAAVNDPPIITTILPTTFKFDTLYSIPLTATDEEGNAITWSIPRKPATMSIVSNVLVWAPTTAGLDTIIIIASDGSSTDTLLQEVQVVTTSAVHNHSQISLPLVSSIAAFQKAGSIIVTAGLPISAKSGVITLFDIAGKRIAERALSGTGWYTFSITNVPPGAHVLRMKTGGKVITQKLTSY